LQTEVKEKQRNSQLMGRITEMHISVATVTLVMVNVGGETNIP